jgi:hypothetical protein
MRIRFILPLLLLVLGLSVVEASAQYSFGYSLETITQPNPNAPMQVHAETGTVLTYNDWYWYDPGIQGFMYEDTGLYATTDRIMNYNGPDIYLWIDLEAKYGRSYKIHGDHYLRAIQYYATSGGPVYVDYWGFNYFQGNFPSPYNFGQGPTGYYYYNTYRAASTEVTLSASRPLHLDSIDNAGGVPGNSFTTTLRGTGLFGPGHGSSSGQTVQVSGSGVTATVQPTSPNSIEVVDVQISVASNAQPGDRSLTLTVGGQTSNSLNFRIGDNSPVITLMEPRTGAAGDNVPVTITGSNFGLNPDVEIQGVGVLRSITTVSPTQIQATFSINQSADPGARGVDVLSRGYTGTGFQSVPGSNSDRSDSVPFEVTAANPRVEIGDIGSVEKGNVKTITVTTVNATTSHTTKLTFKNQTPVRDPATNKWTSGQATFVDPSGNDIDHIEYTGDQPQQVRIRGIERSSSKDNVKIEARFNNDTDVKKDKSFSVSSIAFLEDDECTGFDDLDFQLTNDGSKIFFFVPKGSNNALKAKVVPSGASGNFKLESTESATTIAPAAISSTSSQNVTVTASATASDHPVINVKANNSDPLTHVAEMLKVEVVPRKEKKVVVYAVTEDNDDVKVVQPGQGQPNSVAYTFDPVDNFIDTIAQGDDWLGPVPIGLRPPGYSSRSRRVFTGENGILETMPMGNDMMYNSKNAELMKMYSPITEIGKGAVGAVCITSGTNAFLDTLVDPSRTDDVEETDPNNAALKIVTAGPNGRCDLSANNNDIGPTTPPSVADLQNYLNNTTWARQSNVNFTVTLGTPYEVNFDLDKDKKLLKRVPNTTSTYTETDAIKAAQNPASDTYNLYYVGTEFTDPLVRGFAINIIGQHAWFGPKAVTLGGKLQTPAHEIGHLLGSIHTITGAQTTTDPNAVWYQPDLMYPSYLGGTPNQCRIRKPQWDKARLL